MAPVMSLCLRLHCLPFGAYFWLMARSLRIKRADGVYHIINRGNYRHDLFISDGAHEAFERCL